MDNTQNPTSQTQNPSAVVPTQPVQQQQQPVQYVQQTAVTPIDDSGQTSASLSSSARMTDDKKTTPSSTPVGGMKEGAPVAAPTEWVSPSIPEVTPTAEVSTYVEAASEVPTIPQAAIQAGVKHAKEATPAPTVKVEPINLTTPHPVLVALKKAHGSIKDSMNWLISLIVKEQDKISHTKVHKEKGDFFS